MLLDERTCSKHVVIAGGYGGGGGGGSRGGSDELTVMEDTIFVSGMSESSSEMDIQQHFGSIGVIKNDKRTGKPKIWIYRDKMSGMSKGEATVTYDDANAARSAINWFDGKEFNGSTVKVQMATTKRDFSGGRGRGRGGFGGGRGRGGGGDGGFGDRGDRSGGGGSSSSGSGGGGGGGGGGGSGFGGRDGDWKCPSPDCGNTNFAWRTQCNRCSTSRPDGVGGGDGGGRGSRGGGRGGDRGGRGRGGFGDRGGGRGGGFSRGGDRGGRGRGGSGPMRGGFGGGDRGRDRPKPY
ncbi:hypothetical protein B566_EDAN016465 [Ephemera danica]|nr:hypothetical protein B566_EDAN016465 [Ephemera danica]